MRINSLGLRGSEIEPKRPELTRVLVFGDSYVFGAGVDARGSITSTRSPFSTRRVHEPDRLWDFPGDTHWNRDAHELVAETLFELMRDRYLDPL